MGRLIDADALIEEIKSLQVFVTGLRAGKGILAEYAKQYRKSLLRIIDEQPTAYDVENVVAELEEREEACKKCYVEEMLTGNCSSASVYCGEKNAYNIAVMIVKRGGVE